MSPLPPRAARTAPGAASRPTAPRVSSDEILRALGLERRRGAGVRLGTALGLVAFGALLGVVGTALRRRAAARGEVP